MTAGTGQTEQRTRIGRWMDDKHVAQRSSVHFLFWTLTASPQALPISNERVSSICCFMKAYQNHIKFLLSFSAIARHKATGTLALAELAATD